MIFIKADTYSDTSANRIIEINSISAYNNPKFDSPQIFSHFGLRLVVWITSWRKCQFTADLSLLNNFPSNGVGKSISRLFQVSVVAYPVPSPLVPHAKEFLHITKRFGT